VAQKLQKLVCYADPMNPNSFQNYLTGHFFDEMFVGSNKSEAYDFYQPIYDRIGGLSASEFEEKRGRLTLPSSNMA